MDRLTLRDLRRLAAADGGQGAQKAVWYDAARRLLHSRNAVGAVSLAGVAGIENILDRLPKYGHVTAKDLDRVIAALGAKWSGSSADLKGRETPTAAPAGEQSPEGEQEGDRPEGESRPKGTDEAAPSEGGADEGGADDAATHGGDGNSGECAHPAQTSSAEEREGHHDAAGTGSPAEAITDSESPDSAPLAGQDGTTEPPEADAGTGTKSGGRASTPATPTGDDPGSPAAGSEIQASAPEGEDPTQAAPAGTGKSGSGEGTESAPSDTLGSDSPGGDRDGEDPAPAKTCATGSDAAARSPAAAQDTSDGVPVTSESNRSPGEPLGEQENPVRSPRASHGGTFGSAEAAALLAKGERRAASEVRRALLKLLRALDIGGTEESPRFDGGRVVRELKSRRCQLNRARRRELTQPLIVLACDVSGSCSAVCDDTLAACLAVAAELEGDVEVIQHSNGCLLGNQGPGKHGYGVTLAEWCRQQDRPIGAVVAFGDWDAGDSYQQLCESGAELVWLDSYCCNVTGMQEASPKLREQAKGWKRQPLAWFQGVNDAKSAAIALRLAAKKARR